MFTTLRLCKMRKLTNFRRNTQSRSRWWMARWRLFWISKSEATCFWNRSSQCLTLLGNLLTCKCDTKKLKLLLTLQLCNYSQAIARTTHLYPTVNKANTFTTLSKQERSVVVTSNNHQRESVPRFTPASQGLHVIWAHGTRHLTNTCLWRPNQPHLRSSMQTSRISTDQPTKALEWSLIT